MRLLWRGAQAFIGGIVLVYESVLGVRQVFVAGPAAMLASPPIELVAPLVVGIGAILVIEGAVRVSEADQQDAEGEDEPAVDSSGYNSRWGDEEG